MSWEIVGIKALDGSTLGGNIDSRFVFIEAASPKSTAEFLGTTVHYQTDQYHISPAIDSPIIPSYRDLSGNLPAAYTGLGIKWGDYTLEYWKPPTAIYEAWNMRIQVYDSNGDLVTTLSGPKFIKESSFKKATLTIRDVDGEKFVCFGISYKTTGTYPANMYEEVALNYNDYSSAFNAHLDEVFESPEYGESSEPGGYIAGTHDNTSDTITIPDEPQIGITSCGFINVYKTTAEGLQNLGDDLFPDFEIPAFPTPTAESIPEAVEKVCEALNSIGTMTVAIGHQIVNDKLINYVVDCHVIPVSPSLGNEEAIKIGFKTMSQTGTRVSSDYVTVDCGSLSIGEYYANFIDYTGTRAKLYLPFVGFVDVKPEYFQSGVLKVVYRFNIVDGSFMAYVLSSSSKSQLRETVIGSYGGNACIHIPITGPNYASMISNVVGGASAATVGLATGSIGTVASGAMNVLGAKPDVQSSNSYNATTSMLGVRTPYLVIEREVSSFALKYANERGLPLNVNKRLGDLHGFTKASTLHLDGITCTDTEKNMIEQAIRNGVILP